MPGAPPGKPFAFSNTQYSFRVPPDYFPSVESAPGTAPGCGRTGALGDAEGDTVGYASALSSLMAAGGFTLAEEGALIVGVTLGGADTIAGGITLGGVDTIAGGVTFGGTDTIAGDRVSTPCFAAETAAGAEGVTRPFAA